MNVDRRSLIYRAWGRICRHLACFLATRYPGFMANYLKEPVFMIGSPRGGTSMLAYLLANHPDVSNYSEANEIWEKYLKYERPFWVVPYRDQEQWAREKTERMKDEIKSTFSLFHILSRRRVFLNKCHRNTLRFNEVDTMYPDAKFINVVRDGRYVINSILKHEMVDEEVNMGLVSLVSEDDRKDMIVQLAEYWNKHIEIVENALKIKPDLSQRVYTVKYEDFCREPVKYMDELLEFIGLDKSRYVYTVLDGIKESKGSGINKEEYLVAENIIGPNLEKYSYELWNS